MPTLTAPEYTWREKALLGEQGEIEALLAEALGYRNDPEYGWVTGDHTAVTLAMEVRRKMADLRSLLNAGNYVAIEPSKDGTESWIIVSVAGWFDSACGRALSSLLDEEVS